MLRGICQVLESSLSGMPLVIATRALYKSALEYCFIITRIMSKRSLVTRKKSLVKILRSIYRVGPDAYMRVRGCGVRQIRGAANRVDLRYPVPSSYPLLKRLHWDGPRILTSYTVVTLPVL